jgi:hypothetical protein
MQLLVNWSVINANLKRFKEVDRQFIIGNCPGGCRCRRKRVGVLSALRSLENALLNIMSNELHFLVSKKSFVVFSQRYADVVDYVLPRYHVDSP